MAAQGRATNIGRLSDGHSIIAICHRRPVPEPLYIHLSAFQNRLMSQPRLTPRIDFTQSCTGCVQAPPQVHDTHFECLPTACGCDKKTVATTTALLRSGFSCIPFHADLQIDGIPGATSRHRVSPESNSTQLGNNVTKDELRAELERQEQRYKDVYGGEVTTYAAQPEPERKPWRKRASLLDQAFAQEIQKIEQDLKAEEP
eukprot:gene17159-20435_t